MSKKVEDAEFDFLKPSQPSAPPPPVKIWSPEKPMSHVSLHFGALQDWNWYWETLPPTIAQKTQAQHFFTKKASPKFLQSVAFFRACPESDVPEIAFVGRSNVGKSSLLNAIVNADTKALLARTSATPGFTKTMNLYGLGPQGGVHYKKQPNGHGKIVGTGGITIVDMPGYGEGSLVEWGTEIMKYLQGRKQLRRVFVLIDAEHGIKDKDRALLASLRLGGVSHQVILSKIDKIYLPKAKSIKRFDGKRLDKLRPKGSPEGLRQTMDKLRQEIQPPSGAGAIGEILACSSDVLVDERRLGIDAVRFAMLQAINFPFRGDQSAVELAKKEGPLIRTMKTNPAPEKPRVRTVPSGQLNGTNSVPDKPRDRTVASGQPDGANPAPDRPRVGTVAPSQLDGTKPSAREQRAARRAGRRPYARGTGSPLAMLESLSGSVG
jgi:GTP-binding protein